MKFKRLKLQNIRSYEEGDLKFQDGSTLLSGDVGTGKTTVLLAIEFALFGLQPGQRGAALLSNGKEEGSVVLEFEINDKTIEIQRGLKRTSKSIVQDFASISIDSETLESSVTEIKTKVLQLLNYPDEFIKKNNLLYRYTIYTPQEEMRRIILEDPEQRLNIIRHIFGMEKYKRIKENLNVFSAKLREESRILAFEVKNIDDQYQKIDSKEIILDSIRNNLLLQKSKLESARHEITFINSKLEENRDKIVEKENIEKEIEKAKVLIISKKEQYSSIEKEISQYHDTPVEETEIVTDYDISKVVFAIGEKSKQFDKLHQNGINLSATIRSYENKVKEDTTKKDRIFKIDFCPTCLQDVTEVHKHNILNETESQLGKNKIEIEKIREELQKNEKYIESEKAIMEGLYNKKTSLEIAKAKQDESEISKKRYETLTKNKIELSNDIDLLESHLSNLKNNLNEYKKFDRLIEINTAKLQEFNQIEKGIEIEIAQSNKESEMILKDIENLREEIKEMEKIKNRLIKISENERWLSNNYSNLINLIERNIMLTVRSEFSKLFNQWFSTLTTDTFQVRLDENFTPVISQGDFELEYQYLSGGERTAVALAYRLALNQILNSILSEIKTHGLVILDEPTDGFSDEQLEKMKDILIDLKVEQLILVSHEPKMESFVDHIIKIKKEDGNSTVNHQD